MEGLTYGGAGGAGSSTTTAKYAGYPNPGFPSGVYAGTASQGGAGGCSTYGLGALSTVNQNALSGSGYGSGGGGAGSTTGTDYTGGSGAPGLIIVEEFGVW
jgi:hypothetical protein